MQTLSILKFGDISSFVATYLRIRKEKEPRYSYARLAKKMGLRSQSLVAMVARGQRKASVDFVHRLGEALSFSKKEKEYAYSLSGFEHARTAHERAQFAARLGTLHGGGEVLLKIDAFESIASWQHVAILEMTELVDFQDDPKWIARRLGQKISERQAREALDRLLRLKLLSLGDDGKICRASKDMVKTSTQVPSAGLRLFHGAMLDLAKNSIEEQTVDERTLGGVTMTINKKAYKQIQERVQEFLEKMCVEFQAHGGNETYHLGIQFFRLTKPLLGEKAE